MMKAMEGNVTETKYSKRIEWLDEECIEETRKMEN